MNKRKIAMCLVCILVACLHLVCLTNPARAGIAWSGNVLPADPTTWTSSTYAHIGLIGSGTLSINSGSDVLDYDGYIGYFLGSIGVVTVDGTDSMWTNSNDLFVGREGSGVLNITGGGAVSNDWGFIGNQSGSMGEVTVSGVGSTWTNSSDLYVGGSFYNDGIGSGMLNITGGGEVSNEYGYIGFKSGSTGVVTVSGVGSTWTNSVHLSVGYEDSGTLNITGGGKVSNLHGYIGYESVSTGEVTVDGTGTTWTNNSELSVGRSGSGVLNITGGGKVSNISGSIGKWPGSTGEVTVDGTGSTWTNSNNFIVGYWGSGVLNITGGGLLSVGETLTIDNDEDGNGFINMGTGGMLALYGDADDSLTDFLNLIDGTDAIRYWDDSASDWADITGATYGEDYTLSYLTEGDLVGYTMLTVPEPATLSLLGVGGLLLIRRKRR